MTTTALATGRLIGAEWVVVDCSNAFEVEADAILAAAPPAVRADVALDVDEYELEEQPGVSEASPYFI